MEKESLKFKEPEHVLGKRRKALGAVAEALCRAVRVKADVKIIFRDVDCPMLVIRVVTPGYPFRPQGKDKE